MKKALVFILPAVIFLSGCATYKFQKGPSPYEKGYVALRHGQVIPEYTIGKDNVAPADEQIAKERFQRRKETVELYYKEMGNIENRFKAMFVDPPVFMLKTVGGIFRMPFIAANDYKYNHDPAYKEKVDSRENAEYKAERERLASIKAKLKEYIQEDLKKELPAQEKEAPVVKAEVKEESVIKESSQNTAVNPVVKENHVAAVEPAPVSAAPVKAAQKAMPPETTAQQPQNQASGPAAVIIAKPTKGFSPLTVQFYGSKSFSSNGRIVAYSWDFGDGDVSAKKNPVNTYWSTTYGSRKFTATLTVTDNKGVTSAASTDGNTSERD